MEVAEALKQCSGFVDLGDLSGYYPFQAANVLVGSGEYQFEQSTCWGYVLKKVRL